MDFNKIESFGKGVKVLFTNKDIDITLKPDRFVLSCSLKADFGTTKVGKVYKGQINRESVKIGNDVYDFNFYLVKRTTKTADKPVKVKDSRPEM